MVDEGGHLGHAVEAVDGGGDDAVALGGAGGDGEGFGDVGEDVGFCCNMLACYAYLHIEEYMSRTGSEVEFAQDCAETVSVAVALLVANGNGDVLDGLDVVLGLDGELEGDAGLDGFRDGDAADDGVGGGQEGDDGGDGELHFE